MARAVEEILTYSRPDGGAGLMERVIEGAGQQAARSEVDEVAGRIRGLREATGLSVGEFASLVGTARPRMSTYFAGKVVPSAAMLVRMERAARLTSTSSSSVPSGRGTTKSAAGNLDPARDEKGH